MRTISSLACLLVLASLGALAAEPPALMNYEGVLRDAAGQPVSGTYDMVFRFYEGSVGEAEILIDRHEGANAVEVTDGLFNVALGSGQIVDGDGSYPNDPYLSLADVFRDFNDVWLEISVEEEALSPRVHVVSAAYALNAGSLNGLAAGDFVDVTSTDQTKLGRLGLGGLDVNGSFNLTSQFFASVSFNDGGGVGSQRFSYDIADHIFEITDGLQTDGPLIVGNITDLPVGYNRFAASTFPNGGGFDDSDDLYVGGSFEADGAVFLSGSLIVDNDGPDADQRVRFWNSGSVSEELKWDENGDRFEFSDSLAIAGSIRTGQTQADPDGFNRLGDLGKSPDSDDMTGPQDLYVEGDVEIDETLYINRELVMLDLGPLDEDGDPQDVNQWIFFYDDGVMDNEYLEWENNALDGSDRFEFSDSVYANGSLSALSKNFVQNHPEREDLEIVYTSLEGSEAAVFTRGHARLVAGEARVPLEESFAWVASPERGLTAHLTPRGTFAELFVVSLSPTEIVVRTASAETEAQDVAFDYIVHGLRLGYEDQPAIRLRRGDAPLPPIGAWDAIHAQVPEARGTTPLSRFEAMAVTLPGGLEKSVVQGQEADRLRRAIGQRDGEEVAVVRSSRSREGDAISTSAVRTSSRAAVPTSEESTDATTGLVASAAVPVPEGSGDLRARSFLAEQAGVAGRYPAADAIESGDVVVMQIGRAGEGGLRRATRAEDPTVIGIAAAEAGVVFAQKDAAGAGSGVNVALSGIVPCKVDASYGAILPGDLLVTSPTPGHAMRSGQPLPGTVVGKALESLADGQGTIAVLVFQR